MTKKDRRQWRSTEAGLLYSSGLTLEQVGRRLGVSRQRVEQILPRWCVRGRRGRPKKRPGVGDGGVLRALGLIASEILTDWSTARVVKVVGCGPLPPRPRRGLLRVQDQVAALYRAGLPQEDIEGLTGASRGLVWSSVHRARVAGEVGRRNARPRAVTRA